MIRNVLTGLIILATFWACDFVMKGNQPEPTKPADPPPPALSEEIALYEPFYWDGGTKVPFDKSEIEVYRDTVESFVIKFKPTTTKAFSDKVSKLRIGFERYEALNGYEIIDGDRILNGLFLDNPTEFFSVFRNGSIPQKVGFEAVIEPKDLLTWDTGALRAENKVAFNWYRYRNEYSSKDQGSYGSGDDKDTWTEDWRVVNVIKTSESNSKVFENNKIIIPVVINNNRLKLNLNGANFSCTDGQHNNTQPSPNYGVGSSGRPEIFYSSYANIYTVPSDYRLNPISITLATQDNAKLSLQLYEGLNVNESDNGSGWTIVLDGFNDNKTYVGTILGVVTITSESGKYNHSYDLVWAS